MKKRLRRERYYNFGIEEVKPVKEEIIEKPKKKRVFKKKGD